MFPLENEAPAGRILSENLSSVGSALATVAQALADLAAVLQGAASKKHPVAPPLSPPPDSTQDPRTVGEAVALFLASKERAERSPRYLRQLRVSLGAFKEGRARRPLSTVTPAELEAWAAEQPWAPRTRRGYLLDVRTLYAWAVRRGYCQENPAAAVELPHGQEKAPQIHTPDQAASVLEVARRLDLDTMRAMAVRYFAGLRASEAEALEECDLGAEFVTVAAHKAKTRRRRLVRIEPNLRAWLDLGGALPLRGAGKRWAALARALRAAGLTFPHNVARHSFVSYHLARGGSAGKTALEAGHSEAMLFRHYRELATPAQGEAFFQVRPDPGVNLAHGPALEEPAPAAGLVLVAREAAQAMREIVHAGHGGPENHQGGPPGVPEVQEGPPPQARVEGAHKGRGARERVGLEEKRRIRKGPTMPGQGRPDRHTHHQGRRGQGSKQASSW
jgi:integrase